LAACKGVFIVTAAVIENSITIKMQQNFFAMLNPPVPGAALWSLNLYNGFPYKKCKFFQAFHAIYLYFICFHGKNIP
jgi:hypothetical protein